MAYNNGFPMQTTAATGMFNGPSSKGYIVGQAQPDPATRYALRGGIVDMGETLPMYGGCGVFANVPVRSLSVPLPSIGRATSIAGGAKNLIGFAVSDQSYNLVIDPGNQVPAAGSSQTIGWYPLGCRARLAVACDPSLIALAGSLLNQPVSWDFTNQELIPFTAAHAAAAISNAVWNNTAGGQVVFTVGTDLSATVTPGTAISVTGVINTGGLNASAFNGTWDVVSSTGTTITVMAPAAASIGTYTSGGNVAAGGGALPVTVLDILPTGNMVPVYSAVTGNLSWNYSGAAALIQLTGGTVA
jgi:hypothetical protein